MWGKQDLNLRPTGYEGASIPLQPATSNLYAHDYKNLVDWLQLICVGYCGQNRSSVAPLLHQKIGLNIYFNIAIKIYI